MFKVIWHYPDSEPWTQGGGYETREQAEAFVAYIASNPRRHRQTHTHATIEEEPQDSQDKQIAA